MRRRRLWPLTAVLPLLILAPAASGGENEKAVAEVKKRAGRVEVDKKAESRPVVAGDLSSVRDGDGALAVVDKFPRLRTLNVEFSRDTDEGLAHLEGLKSLRALSLAGAEVTAAGLAHLKGLTGLRSLDL